MTNRTCISEQIVNLEQLAEGVINLDILKRNRLLRVLDYTLGSY